MIFERNLEVLKLKNERLWKKITDLDAQKPEMKAFAAAAKNGETILGYHAPDKDYYLNSTYNPSREAEKLMEEYYTLPEHSFLTVCGLANGSFARAFLSHNTSGTLFVYEPDAGVFLTAMKNVDLRDIIAHPNFWLAVGELNFDEFSNFLFRFISQFNEYTNRYIALPIYQKLFPEACLRYSQEIRDKYESYRVQVNTWIKNGKQIGMASIRNMRFLPGCRSGADYAQYFPEELPAIIVAAGPSLQKNVDLLQQAKGKSVIFVVDSAINTVFQHGIQPDFVITVDTNKELKNFTAEGLADTFFLADSTSNTKALDMVKPKNLVFYSADSGTWQRMFQEEGTEIDEVFAGGSVALDAMAVAKSWGFKRIIMIGQDLAMTGNKQYADGDMLGAQTKFNSPTLYVKDIYGNDILTKTDYYTFIQAIEELAFQNPDIDFIDATEGGARKEHTRIMTLQQAIDQYCVTSYDIDGMIEQVPRRFVIDGREKVCQALDNMEHNLCNLKALLETGIEDCRQGAYMLEHRVFDKEKLRAINQRIKVLDETYFDAEEYSLIKKVTGWANYEYESEAFQAETDDLAESIRLYKNSEKSYMGIIEGVEEIIKEIHMCRDEICFAGGARDDSI